MRAAWSIPALLAPALLLLAPACSLIGVERKPARVEPDPAVHCTDTYWLPTADAAATLAATAAAVWTIRDAQAGCEAGDQRCDGQAGLAALFPVPFAVSFLHGTFKVRSCRQVKAWQRATPRPPLAGHNGAACVPVFGRSEGRCDAGYCVRGRCQAEIPPAKLRLFCAEPIARWRATRDPARRADLLAALPPACRPLAR